MNSITPYYKTVQQLLQNQSFSIDEYQREYKWEKKQVEEMLADFLGKFASCYQSGHNTENVSSYEDYFLGSIIVSKRNGKHYLIDGQQRITTLTLLLIHLYRWTKERQMGVAEVIAPLIFSDSFGKKSFNLSIPEREEVIKALFDGENFTPDGKNESIQKMYARYVDIAESNIADDLNGTDALPHFIYWLLAKVGLIEISTDSDKYAYAIFETMNDRGKPLSHVDILKSYLLAPITDSEKLHAANQKWKQQILNLISLGDEPDDTRDAAFIKAWFRAQYAESTRERKAGAAERDWQQIGNAFHRWIRDHKSLQLGTTEANETLISKHLPFFARAYTRIFEASRTYTLGLEAVFYNAHNGFTWQNTVLLAPLSPDDTDDIVTRKLAATARYLDIWIMRRVVNYTRVGYSHVDYAMFLLCRDIRRKPLAELVKALQDKLANDDADFRGDATKRREGLDQWRLNQFSRRYIYHMLARVTSYVETESGKPDMFDKYVDRNMKNPWDIEHICPDTYEAYQQYFNSREDFYSWRDNVAGLLLLPADVNRSLQDKPFRDKAPHYAKQNLYAASLSESVYQHQPQFKEFRERNALPFKAYDNFGPDVQNERRELLHKLVNMIWSPERLVG